MMGELPDWYTNFRASQIAPSVKPWEWDEVPAIWKIWALHADAAERSAQRNKTRPMQTLN